MATALFFTSLLLSWYIFVQKRTFDRYGQSETVKAKFLGYLLEWSASLAVVLLFYHILLLALAVGWRWITVAGLVKLEQWFTAAQKFMARYKPEWGTWIAVLIVLYVFSDLWIRFLGRDTPFRVFKKTKRAVHFLSTLVFLFASFTLLGFHPGEAASTLEIHLQKLRTDYGSLRQELNTALVDATINQTYNKVFQALPDSGAISGLLDDSRSEGARLRKEYIEAGTKYAIHDYKIDNLLKQEELRELLEKASHTRLRPIPVVPAIPYDLSVQETVTPETVTFEKIFQARARVKQYTERFRPDILRLLNRPGGREILLELPKGAIDHLAELLSPVSRDFPVLKPVIDVLKSTLNDAIKQELKRKLDNLAASAVEHPARLESSLPAAAQEIADSAPPKTTPGEIQQFHREVQALRRQVEEIRGTSARLSQNMRAAEIRLNQQHQAAERSIADATVRPRPRSIEPESPPRSQQPIEAKRPVEPFKPRPQPDRLPGDGDGGGGGGGGRSGGSSSGGGSSSSYGQCICNTYVNGALVSSRPIPVGAWCGGQRCGGSR